MKLKIVSALLLSMTMLGTDSYKQIVLKKLRDVYFKQRRKFDFENNINPVYVKKLKHIDDTYKHLREEFSSTE